MYTHKYNHAVDSRRELSVVIFRFVYGRQHAGSVQLTRPGIAQNMPCTLGDLLTGRNLAPPTELLLEHHYPCLLCRGNFMRQIFTAKLLPTTPAQAGTQKALTRVCSGQWDLGHSKALWSDESSFTTMIAGFVQRRAGEEYHDKMPTVRGCMMVDILF